MKIPEKAFKVLEHEGIVSIVTQYENKPHVVNTWNSYIQVTSEEYLLVPVGGMKNTEHNINKNNNVLITFGSREVDGFNSKGTGFLISGTAEFLYEGEYFNFMKEKFSWIRAVLLVKPLTITQTL